MQADQSGMYKSSIDCGVQVVREDGIFGLVGRGLDATLVINNNNTYHYQHLHLTNVYDYSGEKSLDVHYIFSCMLS